MCWLIDNYIVYEEKNITQTHTPLERKTKATNTSSLETTQKKSCKQMKTNNKFDLNEYEKNTWKFISKIKPTNSNK